MNSSIRLLNIHRTSRILKNIRFVSQTTTPAQWDLFSSVCLQRLPVIGPEMNWLERRISEYFNKVEISRSLYSDHEMRHFEDLRRSERISTGKNVNEKDLEEVAKQTATDFEEASIEELKKFTFASKATKADLTNNTASIDRSLDKHLYLVTEQNIGGKNFWMFPQMAFSSDDQSLRKCAERLLDSFFPKTQSGEPSIHVKFLGNCPVAIYSYRYPKEVAESTQKIGSRTFIFKCNLDPNYANKHSSLTGALGEQILKPKAVKNFSWLTRAEIKEKVPQVYWKNIYPVIPPDVLVDLESIMKNNNNRISRISGSLQKFEKKLISSVN